MSDKNIQVVKLISGEEIIGSIEDIEIEGKPVIKITKPAIILLMPKEDNPNEAQIALAPWVPYADEGGVFLMVHAVTAIIMPKAEIVNEYTRITSSIIQPDKKIVV